MESSSEPLTAENYYTLAMDQAYCSASQFLEFVGRPLYPACEERAVAKYKGEYIQETTRAMLIGSILDALWEGCDSDELLNRFPDCVSTRGATKGELKSEFKIALTMYERSLKDPVFCKLMSGNKQTIMNGSIEGLPFKIKMDSFVEGICITDLKTTKDTSMDCRYYIPDSGERLPFYLAMSYDVQLAVYREIVRQNTGDTLRCYVAAVDKNEHPMPLTLELEPRVLDKALDYVKSKIEYVTMLRNGEIENLARCETCNYCRDTVKCKIISTSEFETHDIPRDAV